MIWESIESLAESLQKAYSVTGKKAIREQYLNQVKQYPLYTEWFNKIIASLNKEVTVLEYGSGPGILAEKLVNHPKILNYKAVEPEQIFREMTQEKGIHLI